jgi:superoxide dismutase
MKIRSRLIGMSEGDAGKYGLGGGVLTAPADTGLGLVSPVFNAQTGRFFNGRLGQHDAGPPVGIQPLLVMHMLEHAFLIDYDPK